MYLILTVLGLRCCSGFSLVAGNKWGLVFIAVCGFLIAVASLTVEHGLEAHGLQELWCGL